eukprot:gene8150-7506_t
MTPSQALVLHLASQPLSSPSIIIDDLGHWDTQVYNPDSFMTPNFGALAKE